MKAIIKPTKLQGSIEVEPSKSHAHRLLIAAYLSGYPNCVKVDLDSDDIEATRNSLNTLFPDLAPKVEENASEGTAATSAKDDNVYETARHVAPGRNKTVSLDCNESGSTLRFLLPVAKVFEKDVTFKRSGRLPDRPLSPLDREMRSHGCVFITNENDKSLTVRGQLKGGHFTLPGNITSQFVTGLLFALPLTQEGGTIRVEKPVESKPYIDLTLSVLKTFNISFKESESAKYISYTLPGNQKYDPAVKRRKGPLVLEPEGDWSNGAFWLGANALGSAITISGLDEDAVQGDREIVNIITSLLKAKDSGQTRAENSKADDHGQPEKKAVTIDASNCPDLVPIISVLACGLGVETHIVNAGRLRAKESDRLSSMEINLNKLGFNVSITTDGLVVSPDAPVYEGDFVPERTSLTELGQVVEVDSFNDHRIVMAMAIASTFLRHPIVIKDCEAVNKSYPSFFEDFVSLGGQVGIEKIERGKL